MKIFLVTSIAVSISMPLSHAGVLREHMHVKAMELRKWHDPEAWHLLSVAAGGEPCKLISKYCLSKWIEDNRSAGCEASPIMMRPGTPTSGDGMPCQLCLLVPYWAFWKLPSQIFLAYILKVISFGLSGSQWMEMTFIIPCL